ncbi:MAG: DEAD/DEAH box helicase [Eubacteriaceae bacterium]
MAKTNFEIFGLSKEILKSIEMLEYTTPTEVQTQVIPDILKNKDTIVKSQTGSGKTAAFGIPLCEKLKLEQKKPQALVLAPTRELAIQVKEDISNIGRFKKIRCVAVFGRHPIDLQKRDLRQRVHIIVGTPGRTLDHIQRKNIELEEIKYLVIDEADEMLNMGFIDQVEAIIKLLPKKRVTLLFSATMPDKIEEICNEYIIDPKRVEIEAKIPAMEKIKQVYYSIEENEKFDLINKIFYIEKPGSCILFCNTREKVEEVANKMKQKRYSYGSLHGGMKQRERIQTINGFKRGEFQFLIATDVAARGIHVEDITHVINYEVPVEKENYIHRIGRTGRRQSHGKAITLVSQREVRRLNEIEEYLDYKIPNVEIPSQEQANKGKNYSQQKNKPNIKPKIDSSAKLNKGIMKIRINVGKKKKMRPGDILGALVNIIGISKDDIGIIDVQDTCSYVEIFNGKGDHVINTLKNTKIKGKIYTVKKVRPRSF